MGIRPLLTASLAAVLFVLFPAAEASAKWVPTTRVDVDSTPSGAEVYLVERVGAVSVERGLGITPLAGVRLPRGLVTLVLKRSGYEVLTESVEIARKRRSFVFNLIKAVRPATLEFIAEGPAKGAKLSLDGKAEGKVPASVSVPPGRHFAVVTRPGYKPWERWIEVTEGQKVTFEVVMKASATASGSLLVSSTPSGAEIRLNGAPRGVTPTVLDDLEPGEYAVDLILDGYESFRQVITVVSTERAVVNAGLVAAVASSAPTGSLSVTVDLEGATIFIDGKDAGSAPLTKDGLSEGTHVVEARIDGRAPVSKEVEVMAGAATGVLLTFGIELPGTTEAAPGADPAPAADPAAPPTEPAPPTPPPPGTRSEEELGTGSIRVVTNVAGAMANLDNATPTTVPHVWEEVPVGTHFVKLTAAGWKPWTGSITVVRDQRSEVVAQMEKAKPPRVRHRAMSYSAQPIDKGYGTLELASGWPYVTGVRINGGLIDNVDLGFTWRGALDTINEFEFRGKLLFARSRAFALSGEAGLGGGIGGDERNSMNARIRGLVSILIAERAAVTLRAAMNFYSDSPAKGSEERRSGVQFLPGVSVEFRTSKFWNGFFVFEGEPFTDGRAILDDGGKDLGIVQNRRVRIVAGLSLLF